MATAIATDKKAIMRDKRAQGIAAMGLVTRKGDRFEVQTPSLRGRRAAYEVWRDETGRVRCSCLEFEEGAGADQAFRCEHILAVKHSLTQRNTEAAIKPQTESPTPDITATVATTPATTDASPQTTNESASEKPLVGEAEPTADDFAREQSSSVTAEIIDVVTEHETHEEPLRQPSRPAVRQLAQHTTDKEFMMKKQANVAAIEADATEQVDHDEFESNTGGSVVPLKFTNVLRTLRQPVDPKLVKTREGWTDRGGNTHMVEYIEWHTVADTLDRTCPAWSHSVKNIVQVGDIVAVTAAITIDGVTREGVGTGAADTETGIKKAEHDALKRAAIKFGLARDLYQRESEVIERTGATPESNGEFPRDPLAKSMSDLVTPKQLGMIRALAREANVDVEEECQAQLRCRTEEISKRAASSFIDHLKTLSASNAGASVNAGMRRAS